MVPGLEIKWDRALTWEVPTDIENSRKQLVKRQQIIELEPNLKEYPEEAYYAYDEGALDPILTARLLVKKAEENGANILFDTKVVQIITEDSKVVGVNTSH